jgi:short subunit dehydrogenase-like uncharacterized protein
MSEGRIIVFGATGFTGRLTVDALVEKGVRPVIAGRNREKLEAVSSGVKDLEVAVADVSDPGSIQALLTPGDVLISTVGPFHLRGEAAVKAALAAGAHYIDSTGEIAFSKKVVEECGSRAADGKLTFITAAGYDFVPGNCAAAEALRRAGEEAVRVDVGYFAEGGRFRMSQGTFASLVGATIHPGPFFRKGRTVMRFPGKGLRRLPVNGRKRPGISISSTEHLFLPREHPRLTDVNVYLGWFGGASYLLVPGAWMGAGIMSIPGLGPLLQRRLPRRFASRGKGPGKKSRQGQRSQVVAFARDRGGAELSRAELAGENAYDFTAGMIAWMARRIRSGQAKATGAVGPVEAFGLDELIEGCREAGLALT